MSILYRARREGRGGFLRAALLVAPGRIEVRDTGAPRAEPGDALVRVRAVGVCGTDLSIYEGKIPVAYPRVLGHEIVGDLVDPGSSPHAQGTKVIVDPGLACGTCLQCREGRTNICTRAGLLGRDIDGGLRESLPIRASHVYALPGSVDERVAPLLQVLATCVHAQRLVPIAPGERVVVLGLGVTGLLHVQLAKLWGAHPVIGVSRTPSKLDLAERLGADLTVRVGEHGPEEVAAVEDADVVIESAGTPETLGRAIAIARVGGRVLAYGTITGTEGSLPYYDIYYKELAIFGARSACAEDFPASIDLVASERVVLDPLVTDRFTIEAADEAIRAGSSPGALKVLVDV